MVLVAAEKAACSVRYNVCVSRDVFLDIQPSPKLELSFGDGCSIGLWPWLSKNVLSKISLACTSVSFSSVCHGGST